MPVPIKYANTQYVSGQHTFKNIINGTNLSLNGLDNAPSCNVMTIINGNVGIGTTNPQYPLHVIGAIKADSYIGISQQSGNNTTNSNETITTPWLSLNSNITSTINIPSNSNILATSFQNAYYASCAYDKINQYTYISCRLSANNTLSVKNLDETSTGITIPSHTTFQQVILKYDYDGKFISWATIRGATGYKLKIFGNYLYFIALSISTSGTIVYNFSTTSSLGTSPFTTDGTSGLVVKYNLLTASADSWWTTGITVKNNTPYSPNGADINSFIIDNNQNIYIALSYTSDTSFTTNRFNTTSTPGTKSSFTLPASAVSIGVTTPIIIQFDSSGIPIKWTQQLAHDFVVYNIYIYVTGAINDIYNFTSTTLGTVVKNLGGQSGIVKYDTTTGNAISWTSTASATGDTPYPPRIVMDSANNLYWCFKAPATAIYSFYTTTPPTSSGSIANAYTGIVKFTNDIVSSIIQINCVVGGFYIHTDIANNLYLSGIIGDTTGVNKCIIPSFNPYSKVLEIPINKYTFYYADLIIIKWLAKGEVKNMLYLSSSSISGMDKIELTFDNALNMYLPISLINSKLTLYEFGFNSMVNKNKQIGVGTGEEAYIVKYNERGELGNYNIAYNLPPCSLNIYNEKTILVNNNNDVNITIIGSNLDASRTVESFDITNKSIKANWIYDKYVLSGQNTNYLSEDKASIVKTLDIDYNCIYINQQNADGLKVIDASQFYRRTANSSAITTTATNVFGVSPFIRRGSFYNFEYKIIFTNSTTGAITLGWNNVDIVNTGTAYIYAIVKVIPNNAASTTITTTTFNSTANKAIGGGSSGTYLMTIKGFLLTNESLYLPLVVSTSAGNITILSGSRFKLTNRGYTASIGNIV